MISLKAEHMTTSRRNKYGAVAVRATVRATRGLDPTRAWQESAKEEFPGSPSSQKKGCPRSTYLALAGAGHLKNVAPGQYTSATENRQHAEDALQGQQPPVTKIDLQDLENSQIDWSRYQPHQSPVLKAKKQL